VCVCERTKEMLSLCIELLSTPVGYEDKFACVISFLVESCLSMHNIEISAREKKLSSQSNILMTIVTFEYRFVSTGSPVVACQSLGPLFIDDHKNNNSNKRIR
jgi:hypothetical protein